MAEMVAQEQELEEGLDLQEGKYLTFPLADSNYGIAIEYIKEVVIRNSKIKITQVPHMPPYSKGVINLRGKVIPVIDLRARFMLTESEESDRSCFVVVNIKDVLTGLIVDTVSGVVSIPNEEVDPPPQLETSVQSKFIFGMGKAKDDVYILLNIQELIHTDELETLKKNVGL